MTDSPTTSPCNNTHDLQLHENNKIPVEIISDEEMAFIEAAFSLAARRSSSSTFSLLSSCKSLREFSSSVVCCDVEDLGQIKSPQKKKTKVSHSLLSRFRKKRGLSVTDLTSTVTGFFLFIVDFSLSLCFLKWVWFIFTLFDDFLLGVDEFS